MDWRVGRVRQSESTAQELGFQIYRLQGIYKTGVNMQTCVQRSSTKFAVAISRIHQAMKKKVLIVRNLAVILTWWRIGNIFLELTALQLLCGRRKLV